MLMNKGNTERLKNEIKNQNFPFYQQYVTGVLKTQTPSPCQTLPEPKIITKPSAPGFLQHEKPAQTINRHNLAHKIASSIGVTLNEVILTMDKLKIDETKLNKRTLEFLIKTLKNNENNTMESPDQIPILSQPQQTQHDTSGYFESDTKLQIMTLFIDSKDRNTVTYPANNPFSIHFGYPSSITNDNDKYSKGYIDRQLTNITEIKLISAIIPTNTYRGDNNLNYPYILLEIPELGSNFMGTNQAINTSFAKIVFNEKVNNKYLYYEQNTNANLENSKRFSPRISLNKLTFHLKTPDGETLKIQSFIDETRKINSHVVFVFEIKYWQRTLDTVYIY